MSARCGPAPRGAAPAGAGPGARGRTLLEALVALALVGMALSVAVPSLSEIRERGRAAAGARHIAGRFQLLRWQSVALGRSRGLLFRPGARGWEWLVVEDGNGNGLRTAEVGRGTDPVLSGPHDLADVVEGVVVGFPPGGPFPRIPPERGEIVDTADPVQFGRSNLVSFSPLGRSSSGTVYVTDARSMLYGVVLFGPSARVRVWKFDVRSGRWTL